MVQLVIPFYKRFGLLLAGGLLLQDDQLTPFLGPNVPISSLDSTTTKVTTQLLLKEGGSATVSRERSLRNRIKTSASYKWHVLTRRFADKGFCTADPLSIVGSTSHVGNVASYVLRLSNDNALFTKIEHDRLLKMMEASPYIKQEFQTFQELLTKLQNDKVDHVFLKVLYTLERNKGKKVRQILKGKDTVALSAKTYPVCKKLLS